jgi:hypothetical protein
MSTDMNEDEGRTLAAIMREETPDHFDEEQRAAILLWRRLLRTLIEKRPPLRAA